MIKNAPRLSSLLAHTTLFPPLLLSPISVRTACFQNAELPALGAASESSSEEACLLFSRVLYSAELPSLRTTSDATQALALFEKNQASLPGRPLRIAHFYALLTRACEVGTVLNLNPDAGRRIRLPRFPSSPHESKTDRPCSDGQAASSSTYKLTEAVAFLSRLALFTSNCRRSHPGKRQKRRRTAFPRAARNCLPSCHGIGLPVNRCSASSREVVGFSSRHRG